MIRSFSFLLSLILAIALLCACNGSGAEAEQISADDIAQVTATDALYSSYMYVVEDRTAIGELCAMYNSLTYRELNAGEEAPEELLSGKLYSLMFYNADGEVVTDCHISPEGYVRFRDSEDITYVLTGGFDEDKLVELLEGYNTFK